MLSWKALDQAGMGKCVSLGFRIREVRLALGGSIVGL